MLYEVTYNVICCVKQLCTVPIILLSVLGKTRLLNTHQPSKMDGLKDRRNGTSQPSVPESPPDMDTFETIDNPHIIINGESVIRHGIHIWMEVPVHSF